MYLIYNKNNFCISKTLKMKKNCTICSNEFETKTLKSKYCSKQCQTKLVFNKKQKKILDEGIEGIDYIIDKWNGYATPRIYGAWMRAMHPGKTTKDYLNDFPNSPLTCDRDKNATSINSGLHMKDPKYRKMASDAMMGELNPNHKAKTTIDERMKRSPFSKKFKKYKNEDERDNFVNSIDWDNRLTSTNLQWWINKGYDELEAIELLKERQTTFSLDICIEKHGEEKGLEVFNKRQAKWKKSLQKNFEKYGDSRSPSSSFASSIISIVCKLLNVEVPNKEKWIKDKKTQKAYSYDFTYKKKIIEFNGDYWHCNPNIYNEDYFNKRKSLTAKQIWKYDSEKTNTANKYGYQVLHIWENYFKNNPEEVIKKCIEFLND